MKRKIWISAGPQPFQIDAEVIGNFAINGKRGAWFITHVSTGCRLFDPIGIKATAISIAKRLNTIDEFAQPITYKSLKRARRKTIDLFGLDEYKKLGGATRPAYRAEFERFMQYALVDGKPQRSALAGIAARVTARSRTAGA